MNVEFSSSFFIIIMAVLYAIQRVFSVLFYGIFFFI